MLKEQLTILRQIPRTVWVLCLVSFLMNLSSITIATLSPIFMISGLGATPAIVGRVRGITECLGYFAQIFSGLISDYIGKRKILIAIGYGCAGLTKPIFALATNIEWYTIAQCIDRVSNGFRDTPRDALIADVAPQGVKGTCFSLRHGFATAGSFLGSLLASFGLWYTSNNYRLMYWCAVIPVIVAWLCVIFLAEDPKGTKKLKDLVEKEEAKVKKPLLQLKFSKVYALLWSCIGLSTVLSFIGYWQIAAVIVSVAFIYWLKVKILDLKGAHLNAQYWFLMVVVATIMLARFTQALLILHMKNLNLIESLIPIVMAVMNLAYSTSANIVAIYTDRLDRRIFLWISLPLLVFSYIILGTASTVTMGMVGIFLYGLHMGTTQGVIPAMVADLTPPTIRATSFGIYSVICGFAVAISSIVAGFLMENYQSSTPFLVSSVIAILGTVLVMFLKPTNNAHL